MCTTVSPRVTVREPGGQGGGLREVRQVGPGGGDVVPVRRPAGELVGDGVEVEVVRRGRQLVGHDLERVEGGVELGRPPRATRRPRLDVLGLEHHPVAVLDPQQPGRGHAGGKRLELAGLLAVGVGEHLLGLRRRRLDEVPASRRRR